MKEYAVLVGNDINNISSGYSWAELLDNLTAHLSIKIDFDNKPFPLAYEEIYFKAAKNPKFTEGDVKKFVAKHVNEIKKNTIHDAIVKLETENILTTNYDLSLESTICQHINQLTNKGFISESKYSIFRHHKIGQKKFWHIHGSANAYMSITLGYEHYSGYLQNMRSYVVSGTQDTYKKKSFASLIKRFKEGDTEIYSWIDLFFTTDIHIFGLSLDFNETDLWWMLTYREKSKYINKLDVRNKIYYYIPSEYEKSSKNRIDILKSIGVEVIALNGYTENKTNYYHKVIETISEMYI